METLLAPEVLYERLSTYARWCGIHDAEGWSHYHSENGYPDWIPENPQNFFSSQGIWRSWEHFLSPQKER